MRSRGLTVAAATLVLGLGVGTVPAAAEQLDAKNDPKTSDNVTLAGRKCATERDKKDGEVVAVIHSCQRFYLLDATAEDDGARDYGAFWLQSTIDPAPGWCASSVASDMVFSSTAAKVVSTSPAEAVATAEASRLKTVLDLDANDHATQAGRISQASRQYPDGLTPDVTKADGKTRFRLTWNGSNGHVLALVSGLQVSWKTDDGPPKTTRFGLRKYTLRQKNNC